MAGQKEVALDTYLYVQAPAEDTREESVIIEEAAQKATKILEAEGIICEIYAKRYQEI